MRRSAPGGQGAARRVARHWRSGAYPAHLGSDAEQVLGNDEAEQFGVGEDGLAAGEFVNLTAGLASACSAAGEELIVRAHGG